MFLYFFNEIADVDYIFDPVHLCIVSIFNSINYNTKVRFKLTAKLPINK